MILGVAWWWYTLGCIVAPTVLGIVLSIIEGRQWRRELNRYAPNRVSHRAKR